MSGLISEIINMAREEERILVSKILINAMYAARKLKVKDFESWIDLELTGYKSNNVPSYRIFESEKKYWEDVVFPSKNKKLLGTETIKSAITESIPELEDIYKKNQFVRAKIFERKGYEDKNHQTNIVIYSNKIHGVIESVRTSILQWAMDLEEIDVHIEKKGLRGSVWVQSGVFG